MSKKYFKNAALLCLTIVMVFFSAPVLAQEYYNDLEISTGDVRVPGDVVSGKNLRIYVTVRNNSHFDLSGVVKFYDENLGDYLSADQPVSILAQSTDDVFIDWLADGIGTHPIAVRVVPWSSDGDNPGNNKVVKNVYVDRDSDGDGIGDRLDGDDDNDGTPDTLDDLPLDPTESKDTDGDGIGDNSDPDDDGDGVNDIEDSFPLDPKESKDTDGDGAGDNSDLFPYNSNESKDTDGDGLGDNADPNDNNHAPKPFIQISDTKTRAGKALTFNALKSDDPDGEIISYKWDFGDGTVDTGVIIDHVFKKSGEYIVTLRVTDDKNEANDQQIQIQVGWNLFLLLLIVGGVILLLLLILMFIPQSRFHHTKLKELKIVPSRFAQHHVDES